MYAATGDHQYVDYLDRQWQRSSDLLYDPDEHLYARDAASKNERGVNGKKIFWSRDEGLAMAGLVRTLQYLPSDDSRRSFYVNQLREMSEILAPLQDSKGLWHAILLDPVHYPEPEIAGSTLFVYAMSWGVNEGVLDASTYRPVIERAWIGILQHVYADGRLGDIQPIGSDSAAYAPASSSIDGVGGYLLAASELKRLAALPAEPPFHAHLTLPTPANPQVPTLFLVGDATVRDGIGDGANNQMGWGEPLAAYFDPAKINIVNRAIGGRSSRTYITESYWNQTLALMKPGDVVLIQFGLDDAGPLEDAALSRGSLPGVSDETLPIENPITHRHEVVHTFGWYLDQYVKGARAKGATPILCSPDPRQVWQNGRIARQDTTYAGWTREVAENDHVDFIDLNAIVASRYDALGEAGVKPLFADAETHTTLAGATLNAESVVAGLKTLPDDPVAKDFSARAASIPAAPAP